MNKSYVYMAFLPDFHREGDTIFKIGVSMNPWSRRSEMQTACPFPIEILKTWLFESRMDAFDIERNTHEHLDDIRLYGEWFQGDLAKACFAVEQQAFKQFWHRRQLRGRKLLDAILNTGVSESDATHIIEVYEQCGGVL